MPLAKMGYAISLINNILDAQIALKIKLLGSMFPEKIEFDGKISNQKLQQSA